MRLVIDARSLGRKPSGIGIYTYNMVKGLMEFHHCEMTLLTDVAQSNEIRELSDLGIEIQSYGKVIKKNLALFLYYRFVQKEIDRLKPDVFWECNNLVPIGLKNPYGKLVVTIHDVFPITHSQYYSLKYKWYFQYGLQNTIKNFDLLIYNSIETKKMTEQYFPSAQNKDSLISYIIVPKLPELKITNNESFLYIGNLEKRKGTDILLEAYRRYRSNGGKRSLRLGGNIREPELFSLIQEINQEVGGIYYLGYISEQERNVEYASCHCFVFPSKAEGFGIPIIEVMNYNKPIIVMELSIYHELMGESIVYVEDDSKFETVCENLANVMRRDIFFVDENLYSKVIERYESKVLSEKIYDKFNEYYNLRKEDSC